MVLECLNTVNCDQGAVRAVRFNITGCYCLTCGSDKKIKLWNPYRTILLKTYGGHSDDVTDAAGSCDSSQIISSSNDKSVIIWDVSTGHALRRLRGHAGAVTCVTYNENSSVAVSGSKDNTVCCWDMKSKNNNPIQVLADARDCITSVKISGPEIMTSSVDCFIRKYDLRNGKLISDFLGEPITCVSYTNDGECILASCADNSVKLLEKLSGDHMVNYSGHKADDVCIESSTNFDDSLVISGSINGEVYCWDLINGEVSFKLVHNMNKAVHSISVHPQRNILLSASVGSIKLWGQNNDIPCENE